MWLFGFAKAIVKPIYHLFYRIQVEGLEHIPTEGGAIICGNHFSMNDPIIVGITANRPVAFMAKQELFTIPVLGGIVRGLGAFPVKRGKPDMAALKTSLKVLKEGGCFGIFPEGTRSRTGQLAKPEPGAAFLAIKSGAPVIPVGITSTYKLFSPIIVKFGEPVSMEAFRNGKVHGETLEAASEAIITAIGALLVPPHNPPATAGGEK